MRMHALTACVCAHAAICIVQAVRKTLFTVSVKLARGSPQDVHTLDLPIVNRLSSVFLNLFSASFALFLFIFFDQRFKVVLSQFPKFQLNKM